MILLLNFLGLVFGKWWKVVVPLGGAFWAREILGYGRMEPTVRNIAGLVFLGAANTAGGAVLNRGLAWIGRRLPDEGRWPQA